MRSIKSGKGIASGSGLVIRNSQGFGCGRINGRGVIAFWFKEEISPMGSGDNFKSGYDAGTGHKGNHRAVTHYLGSGYGYGEGDGYGRPNGTGGG